MTRKSEEQIEDLMVHAGGHGFYQIILLILSFFIWVLATVHNTSLPMLEKMPMIIYESDGKNISVPLTYVVCKKGNYEIVETYNFSWIIELGIFCDDFKVGLIGSIIYVGQAVGSFSYSLLNKYVSPKNIALIGMIVYSSFMFLNTIINYFYFRLISEIFLGIGYAFCLLISMNIVSESVSSKNRNLFTSIINIGYNCSAIFFTPLFVYFDNWRYVFWIHNIAFIIIFFLFLICILNTPIYYFSKNCLDLAYISLLRIVKFNCKLEEFKNYSNDPKFNSLLENKEEEIEDIKEKEKEKKPKQNVSYSSLVKYPSIRKPFLIFTFMHISAVILNNSVTINTKNMEGNIYYNIVFLYVVEILGSIISGFIINWPPLGRKKSLFLFYLGLGVWFILYIIFCRLKFPSIAQFFAMFIVSFCINSVYTDFYVYILESYPTPIRAMGMGLNYTYACIFWIFGPMIIEIINSILLYIIFASICAFDCFLTLFLKETIGEPMPEIIEELAIINAETRDK